MRPLLSLFPLTQTEAAAKYKPGIRFLLIAMIAAAALTGYGRQKTETEVLQDKPLAGFQNDLLMTAFQTASAIPVKPHIKDRSRAQYKVVSAALKLDQPQRALDYSDKIKNWRRGLGYADWAFYCVQRGVTHEVPHYLDLAEQISTVADQDWRRDRIKVRIAQTRLLLGDSGPSEQLVADIDASESGKVERVESSLADEEDFEPQMKAIDGLIASGNFDLIKNALFACTQLFDRFYDDADRRETVERKIKSSWQPLPYTIRIDLLAELAEISLKHTDPTGALELVHDAQVAMDKATWPAEYRIPLTARLAALCFRAGDEETARSRLAELPAQYDEEKNTIINIYRAETLTPVAEAFQTAGDTASALKIYKQALEAGVENPNSRPRAEDLSAICLSMALNQVEPDEVLWARIREVQAALGDPW
jgi:hypothetical protein